MRSNELKGNSITSDTGFIVCLLTFPHLENIGEYDYGDACLSSTPSPLPPETHATVDAYHLSYEALHLRSSVTLSKSYRMNDRTA